MGGDFGPSVVVPGGVAALRERDDLRLALYGDRDAVAAEIAKAGAGDLPIDIVHCSQDIAMGESPASAVRNRPDAPIVRAMRDHKEGLVDAVASAGSTGAMVAASLMLLGRLPGASRPAIATVIPTLERPFLLLDAGANVQNTPGQLLAFARMGRVYSHVILDVPEPRVGLLNIGEEPSKGTELTVEANRLMTGKLEGFVGNVESRGLMLGTVDVVVTDGFTGNMTLKTIEGFGAFLQRAAGMIGGGSEGGAGELLKRMDYAATGGALLLGVAGSVIISHGSSSVRAVTNAVLAGRRLVSRGLTDKIAAVLGEDD